jgi:D-alanine-D-alanine ligase
MKKKLRIGIIFGGRSGEHEVSLVSAESIIKCLDKSKYEVVPIGITKKGKWLTSGNPIKILKAGRFNELKIGQTAVPDSAQKCLVGISANNFTPPNYKLKKLDLIIPILHGTYGEDGTIQGFLELTGIPYVGANVLASAVGMDKIVQKQLFSQAGLDVVPFTHFLAEEWRVSHNEIIKRIEKFSYSMFIKPANLGSSVGISKVNNRKELVCAVDYALKYDRKIIVEKAVANPREIEVAVLGNDSPKASVPGEILASNEFYDYDSKYIDGLSKSIIPAHLPKKMAEQIRNIAVQAFKIVDCSGMARVDFLIDGNNKVFLSEINTIPGFTAISMYPKLWQASGLPYGKLLDELIRLGLQKHKEKSQLLTSYQPKEKWYQ